MPEPPELAQVLAAWGLEHPEVEASATGNGLGVWFVHSATGTYVLRKLESTKWAVVETALLDACSALECVPKLVRTRSGCDYDEREDSVFQLQERLPGADARGLRGEAALGAYGVLARVHTALRSVSPKEAYPRELYASYTGRIEAAVEIAMERFGPSAGCPGGTWSVACGVSGAQGPSMAVDPRRYRRVELP